MQILNYKFRPKLVPTIATVVVLPVLISLGLWQSNKADQKQILQSIYEKRGAGVATSVGGDPLIVENIRYSRVVVTGKYNPTSQVLIDNQIYKGQAGYHVLTPLHINGTNMRVLVNRGWVPVGKDRSTLPVIETPTDDIEVIGYAQDPTVKYIELSHVEPSNTSWQKVWQNLDLNRYKNAVNFPIQSIVILMDPSSDAGGYVREWPKPDTKIEMNRGYAVQWYLMSLTLLVIYLVTNLEKISTRVELNVK